MQIDRGELGRYYTSLSDEELLSLDPDELTETAQAIYDLEIKRRGLSEKPLDLEEPEVFVRSTEGAAPDWLQDAVLACTFDIVRGDDNAARGVAVLQAAGIPSQIEVTREEAVGRFPASARLNVMVPLSLALHAAGVLDRDLLNEEYEAEWRTHLKMLSDQALSQLNPEIFCAGLQDRLTRIKKAYTEEIAARNMQA
jgi:hypothetical protein